MKIKLWFTDFWDEFNPYDNYFTKLLSKHFEIEVSPERPDFLFFSWMSKDYFNYKNCIRIYFTGENIRPDYSICDYSISFDYDTYDGRNLRLPLYALYGDVNQLLIQKDPRSILIEKTKFCNFIYSNDRAKERKKLFDLLSKYKKVDSGGKAFNNIGFNVGNKLDFIKDYKFTIAFENSSYPGYTTEKIFEPMVVDSIPIYWGNPNVKLDFNTRSFVNVHEFDSLQDVVEKVIELDCNDNLYLETIGQPYFINNILNKYVTEENIVTFFNKVFNEKEFSRTYASAPLKIKISVIVPVYNTEVYLRECLDSVLNQDFNDYEIICINDGSPDNSRIILDEYKANYPQISVIEQDNQGLSVARNTGLHYAKGKYVVFLDSDDMLLPCMLSETYSKAEEMELDVLAFNYTESLQNLLVEKKFPYENTYVDGIFYFLHYYIENKDFAPSSSCSYLYNRSFLDANKLRFRSGILHEDEHFFIRMLMHVQKMSLLNKTFYYYRSTRPSSITNAVHLRNSQDLTLICRDLFYYLRYYQCKEPLFYRKIYQLYLSSVLYAIDGGYINTKALIITTEDKMIMRACIQNYIQFYYYSLIRHDVKLFHRIAIQKRPYLLAKLVSWTHKLYYYFFAEQYRNRI